MSWALTLTIPRNPARAPFEQVSDTESAPDLSRVDRPLLVGGGGVAPDDEAILELRNLGREIVGEGVSEILLVRIACQGFRTAVRRWRGAAPLRAYRKTQR